MGFPVTYILEVTILVGAFYVAWRVFSVYESLFALVIVKLVLTKAKEVHSIVSHS